MTNLRLLPTSVRADVLAETAVSAAGGGALRLLRSDPTAPGTWLAEVAGPGDRVLDVRLEPELGAVVVAERPRLRRAA